MALILICDETMMLQKSDFPDYFVKMQHPNDFRIVREPFTEHIFHKRMGHNRLFLRICFKISNTGYIPFTFILDTGAPSQIYINNITRQLLKDRIETDSETEIEFVRIEGRKTLIHPSPDNHRDTNIIGLMSLAHFGFHFTSTEDYDFTNLPEYF